VLENSLDTTKRQTICITGASGFLGSSAVRKFASKGYRVIALTRPTSKSLHSVADDQVKQVRGTIDDWVSVIKAEKPTTVLSFDWSGVERELRADQSLQEANIERVCKLAEAATSVGARNFMAFGSQAETKPSFLPILETELDEPQSEYGAAKIATREKIQAILAGTTTRFLWARIFTVYGPGDTRDSFITGLIRKLSLSENYEISEPSKKWSFLEVSDFAEALYLLHGDDRISGVVNIGNPDSSTIGEVADFIGESLGKSEYIKKLTFADPNPTDSAWIPDTKTLNRLLWKPIVPLNLGLQNTVRWWERKAILDGYNS